jgi:hypothetical protein
MVSLNLFRHTDRVESFAFTNCTVFVFAATAGGDGPGPLPTIPPYWCHACEIDTLTPKNKVQHAAGKKHRLWTTIDARWQPALEAHEKERAAAKSVAAL